MNSEHITVSLDLKGDAEEPGFSQCEMDAVFTGLYSSPPTNGRQNEDIHLPTKSIPIDYTLTPFNKTCIDSIHL